MDIQQREENGIIILALSGKIIGGPDATLLNDRLDELIERDHKKFIIDLAQINWMNSSGLGILINGYSMLYNAGGQLKIASLSETIMNLFKITKLVNKFSIYPTVEEALAAF